MRLAELLAEQQSRGLSPEIKLDEQGLARMVLGEHWLSLEESSDQQSFYVYAPVSQVLVGQEDLFRRVLVANLFGQETGKASLAFDDEGEVLVLFQRFPCESLDFETYWVQLQEFGAYLTHWVEKLEEEPPAPGEGFSLDRHISGLVGKRNLNIYFA